MTRSTAITVREIQGKIIHLPNRPPAMLAHDLAAIYGSKPSQIRQAVRRNPDRFPEDFCFRLTHDEKASLQNETMLFYKGGQAPHAFTRLGANMLSAVLKTPVAAQRAVQIMRAFSALEEAAEEKPTILEELAGIRLNKTYQRSPAPAPPGPDTLVISTDDFIDMAKRIIRLQDEKIASLQAAKRVPSRRLTGDEKTRILSMAAAGMGPSAIGKRTGRPESTIRDYLKRHRKAVN